MKRDGWIKKIEKSYLYVILLLPVAAIILRLSTVPSLSFLTEYGSTIYDHLPILYAMTIAYGFSKSHSGVAVFSAAVTHILFEVAYQHVNPDNDVYILGGIVIGFLVAYLCNMTRTYKFSGGFELLNDMRHLPVLSSVVGYFVGLLVGFVWPYISQMIERLSIWIATTGELGTLLYGFLNRLLLPLGLHHHLNHYLWYEYGEYNGVTGDLSRYIEGDPSAGQYMSGFFVVMMFGLPAIMLAFYRRVNKDNRRMVKGMYIVSASICVLTGITEPVELLFLFLLPKLYIAHAILTGVAMMVTDFFNIHIGFDFSAGLLDYVNNFNKQPGSLWIIVIGAVFAVLYYAVTIWIIRGKEFVSPGDYRESESSQIHLAEVFVKEIQEAFGGFENIRYVNVKFTRFEFRIVDETKVKQELLNRISDVNFIQLNANDYQIITFNKAKYLKEALIKDFGKKVI